MQGSVKLNSLQGLVRFSSVQFSSVQFSSVHNVCPYAGNIFTAKKGLHLYV
jgi:hypothetical protein